MSSPKPSDSADIGVLTYADEEATFYTGKAGDVARPLALTAVGVIWFFAAGGIENITPASTIANLNGNQYLLWSLYLAVACLVLDMCQYLWGSLAWMLSRWSIQEAIVRDKDDRVGFVSAFIWRAGRLVGTPTFLAECLGMTLDKNCSWYTRRELLRQKIREERAAKNLGEPFGRKYGPQKNNAPMSIMFTLKCLAVIASYILLAIAL